MSAVAFPGRSLVRFQHAVLCADCDIISEANHGRCGSCGSQALLGLAKVLGSSFDVSPSLRPCAEVSLETESCGLPEPSPAWSYEFAS
jgi:hypothetical protein